MSTLGTTPDITKQLTEFSNIYGTATATTANTGTGIIYGPYIKAIPSLPVGCDKGKTVFGDDYTSAFAWNYDAATGQVIPSLPATDLDFEGVAYITYQAPSQKSVWHLTFLHE